MLERSSQIRDRFRTIETHNCHLADLKLSTNALTDYEINIYLHEPLLNKMVRFLEPFSRHAIVHN